MTLLRRNAAPAIISILALSIVVIYVYNNLDLMLNEEIAFAIPYTIVMAGIIGAVLFCLTALTLKLRWRLIIPTLIMTILFTSMLVITVAVLPNRNAYVFKLIESQSPLYRESPELIIGHVSSSVLADIRSQLPNDVTIYMVDGSNAQEHEYWVELIDHAANTSEYKIAVFNATDHVITSAVSINEMWNAVRNHEHLPEDTAYKEFFGVPTKGSKDAQEQGQAFLVTRTVFFRAVDGSVYQVKLVPGLHQIQLSVKKQ